MAPVLTTEVVYQMEFKVYCAVCKTRLCDETKVIGEAVYVGPCPVCADNKNGLRRG